MLSPSQLKKLRAADPEPNRVREAMTLAGVTQVQVAEAIGNKQSHVADICSGNYSRLPLETARRLAMFFGCTIEELFPAPKDAVA